MPCSAFMLVAFAYELMIFDQHKRSIIFKAQLTKVMVTVVAAQFIGIMFSSWMLSIIEMVQKSKRELINFNS